MTNTTNTDTLRLVATHSLGAHGFTADAVTVEGAADELDALRALLREAARGTHATDYQIDLADRIAAAMEGTTPAPPAKDMRPHSRACGHLAHDHGPSCHSNCPTCGGKQ